MRRALAVLPVALLAFALVPSRLASETIAFDPPLTFPTGHVPEPIAVEDFDGDGRLDVAIACTAADGASADGSVTVILGDGEGGFSKKGDFSVGETRPEGIAAARIDGDAFPDLVTSNYGGDSVSVLLGNGDGSFGAPIITDVPGGPRFVVAHDFTGDGIVDLATANYGGDSVSVLAGGGSGTFTVLSTIPVGNGPEVIALASLDADPNVDLVTADADGDSITPLRGDGAGGFAAGTPHPVGPDPRFVLAADLNVDGLDELIVANNDARTVTIEQNVGGLSFTTVKTLSFSSSSITLRDPVYLDLADMNGDGRRDILVTWARSDAFSVFPQGAGAFDFDEVFTVQTGRTPVGIAAGDLDGDGDVDAVVTNAVDDTADIHLSYGRDPGVILDNGAPGTTAIGPWTPSATPFAFGSSSLFSKNGTRYVWEPAVPAPGAYEVLLWWTVTPWRSSGVPVEVRHGGGSSSVIVDQTRGIGRWNSLGAYELGHAARVTVIAPQDDQSVSADAVRLRALDGLPPGPPRGRLTVAAKPRPATTRIDSDSVLAFHGSVALADGDEAQDFVAVVFSPVGPGEESLKIVHCRLYIDSNENGAFDGADRQLGEPLAFATDARAVTFDGFAERLEGGSTADVFVVADLAPAAVPNEPPAQEPPSAPGEDVPPPAGEEPPPLGSIVVAGGALSSLLLGSRKGRRRLALLPLLLVLAVPLAIGPLSGCKHGGGHRKSGGTPQVGDLQLELSAIVASGADTGTPSVAQGLPAVGYTF
ncbi:MAG: VCBS repeat-containing protein [Planctomycetes bacterium]|nr:VCBS repeat-containing protein [Planctomycetota bacterium]